MGRGGRMKKLALILAICGLATLGGAARVTAQAPPGPMAAAPQDQADAVQHFSKTVTAYTLPPELYAKTQKLAKLRVAFLIISPIYGLVLLWLFLRWKWGPKYRDWGERASGNFVIQALVFAPVFI